MQLSLPDALQEASKGVQVLKRELETIRVAKAQAVSSENFASADALKKQETELHIKLKAAEELERKQMDLLGKEKAILAQSKMIAGDPVFSVPMYLGSIESILKSDVIEVLRFACVTNVGRPLPGIKPQSGCSDAVQKARDSLDDDPYDVKKICKLGCIYISEGKWPMAMNVLMRGWKRVDTLEDKRLQEVYLMKLCEASYRLGKPKQALAVLKDAKEPTDRDALKSFQLLSVRILAANGEVQEALKVFSKAIEGETMTLVVRLLAAVVEEMQKAGAYEAAKNMVDEVAKANQPAPHVDADGREYPMQPTWYSGELMTLESYADALKRAKEEKGKSTLYDRWESQKQLPQIVMGVGIAVSVTIMCCTLYWLEQRSLRSMGWAK